MKVVEYHLLSAIAMESCLMSMINEQDMKGLQVTFKRLLFQRFSFIAVKVSDFISVPEGYNNHCSFYII